MSASEVSMTSVERHENVSPPSLPMLKCEGQKAMSSKCRTVSFFLTMTTVVKRSVPILLLHS